MLRHAFAFKIADDSFNAFRSSMRDWWADARAVLDDIGAGNFSLWSISRLVFGYYETEKEIQPGPETKALYKKVEAQVAAFGEWISPPTQEMRLMYEDFGIVRENKELIRHRVFATQLKGDLQEEYKRRHDVLAASREGKINPGPDSNFSIWNAGRYIFGYDEIDVTMEEALTEESRQAAIDWETKMLEIMDWFTDDVDWLTGERHPHVQRIAGYK